MKLTKAIVALATTLTVLASPAAAVATDHVQRVSIEDVKHSGGGLRIEVALHAVDPGGVRPSMITATLGGRALPVAVASADSSSTTPARSTAPRQALLLLDTSGSMAGGRIIAAREAAAGFLRAAPADVAVGIASVAEHTRILVRPTQNRRLVSKALQELTPEGQTHLFDGIQRALAAVGRHGQRLVVVLSDGADTGSSEPLRRLLQQIRMSGATVDAVGLATTSAQKRVLTQIAANGSGRLLTASDAASLAGAFRATAQDLVSRLSLVAHPSAAFAGRSVPLTVRVDLPKHPVEATTTVLVPTSLDRPPGGTPPRQSASHAGRGLWGSSRGLQVGLIAIFGALWLFGIAAFAGPTRSRRLKALLDQYSTRQESPGPTTPDEASALGGTGLMRGVLSLTDRLVQKEGREERLALLLDRAAVRLRPNEWLVVRGISGLVGIAILTLLGHSMIVGLIAGGPLGLLAPQVWLKHKARRRRNAFVDRLPDSLQLVAGSLSAGYSLLQALDGLVQEGEEPVAGEVGRALATARLGVPIEDALDQVATRLDSADFSWTTMAIRIQREVGGNLGEVLLTVGETLRERAALRRQVRALSAEGRLSAYILIAIPLLLGLYELLFRRSYTSVMWTTTIGSVLLVTTVVFMVVGTIWMRKVVNVEV